MSATKAPLTPTPQCLNDDTVAALAEGALSRDERSALVPHLATCTRCRVAVASVAGALAERRVARELSAADGAAWRRFRRIVAPLAAAAVLLVLVWWPRRTDDGLPAHRSPPLTVSAAPVPASPVGTVAAAQALRWNAVGGADRYRVTLFEVGGTVLYETQLADTVAALPDSVVLVPGRPYLWKVEARTGWDRWTTSQVVEFVLAAGATP